MSANIPVRVQEDVIRAGRRMDERGWVPATAGNISVRFYGDEDRRQGRIAVTKSGEHKGFLNAFSVIEVGPEGQALRPDVRPSAETLLHCQIYRVHPDAGAVLHGHSIAGTVLSMREPGDEIRFQGYELFKAFAGQTTHATTLGLKLFANDQDMARLTRLLEPHLPEATLGYYIRGHGAYVWGPDMDTALARLEALEFLLECELRRRLLAAGGMETSR